MIETERLVLRPPTEADLAFRQGALNTPAVTRYLGGVAEPEALAERFAKDIAAFEGTGRGFWIVTLKDSGEPVGRCGVGVIDHGPERLIGEYQIGWGFAEGHWGKGYAIEAASAVLDHVFADGAIDRIWSQTSASNGPSSRLMDRLGLHRRADLDYPDDDYPPEDNPTTVYEITSADWKAR